MPSTPGASSNGDPGRKMDITVGMYVTTSEANPTTPVLNVDHMILICNWPDKILIMLQHLVTFNLFLRNGNAMLPTIPTNAARAESTPRTDSRIHCRSAYP